MLVFLRLLFGFSDGKRRLVCFVICFDFLHTVDDPPFVSVFVMFVSCCFPLFSFGAVFFKSNLFGRGFFGFGFCTRVSRELQWFPSGGLLHMFDG